MAFPVLCELKLHAKRHDGSLKINCDRCGVQCADSVAFRHHVERVHEKKIEKHPCKLCPEIFPRKAALVHHEEVVHYEKEYRCKLCEKTFSTKRTYLRHNQKEHRKKKKVGCDICGNEFSSKEKLRKHLKLHSEGGIPFRCDLCDYKGISSNSNVVSALLANHKKKVHKEEYEM